MSSLYILFIISLSIYNIYYKNSKIIYLFINFLYILYFIIYNEFFFFAFNITINIILDDYMAEL